MAKQDNLNDQDVYKQGIYAREELSTTGIGEGIAIPHAQSEAVNAPELATMVVKDGVDYQSLDNQPAKLFFMIAVPKTGGNEHLQILAMLSQMLMDTDFKDSLINAQSVEEFMDLINQKEATQKAKEEAQKEFTGTYRLLAVTACPTGIAHTYMSAEALEEKVKQMGITIKVETDGSGGTKNAPTAKEIEECEAIIVAADKNVEMARFDGKPMIQTKVANGINKAEELLREAMSGTAPVYHASQSDKDSAESAIDAKDSFGRQIYKHLMNGVSHMLPFVIGGGILIALAFLFDTFDPANAKNFGSGTPLSAFLMKIGGASFGFMLPVLAGYIAMSIADRPGLVAGFVGGLLANQGGSGFLGALIAGFAAGYLVLLVKKLVSGLPQALEGTKPVLFYPVLGVLFIGIAITFIINPPVSALNEWLMNSLQTMGTTSRVLLGLVFGAMMSVDMGGPVNKAAYVIGTGALATGEYGIMAAVMAGGMVPPLAIALCTTFFPSRFTEAERKSGITNYIMGLSFITEGAIPFAAADPIRVLPSCIIGAGTAGALSMFFECTLRAPHGGIFVVPTIGNPLLYLASIAIGSVVACIILAIVKPKLKK